MRIENPCNLNAKMFRFQNKNKKRNNFFSLWGLSQRGKGRNLVARIEWRIILPHSNKSTWRRRGDPKMTSQLQSNSVITNSSGPAILVSYNRVNLCTKITNLILKSVRYNRMFVNNWVCYIGVSLYFIFFLIFSC